MSEVKKAATAIDRATKAAAKVAADAVKAANDLQAVVNAAAAQTVQMEDAQAKLDALDQEYSDKQRLAAAELNIRVSENEQKVMRELMKKNGMAEISQADLHIKERSSMDAIDSALRENERIKADFLNQAKAEFNLQVGKLQSDHAVQMAQTKADLEAKDSKIAFLQSQLSYAQAQVEAERSTRLEVAKAEAQRQGVVVNAGKQ